LLALLATASTPSFFFFCFFCGTTPLAGRAKNQPQQSFTQLGASTVIGRWGQSDVKPLAALLGVSKAQEIDPQFTGVENNPQARLNLEKSVTKNVTLTPIFR